MTYRERLDDLDELKPTTLLDQINLYSAHKQSFLGKLPHYKYTDTIRQTSLLKGLKVFMFTISRHNKLRK